MSALKIAPKVSSEIEAAIGAADVDANTVSQMVESEQRLQAIKGFAREGTPSHRKRGWEATIGTLDANPLVKEIIEAGKAVRQSERLE